MVLILAYPIIWVTELFDDQKDFMNGALNPKLSSKQFRDQKAQHIHKLLPSFISLVAVNYIKLLFYTCSLGK